MYTRLLLLSLMSLLIGSVQGACNNVAHKNNSIEKDGLYSPRVLELYNSSDNDENIYLNDNYAPYYFSNLDSNFGRNTKGSCGYVATAMLLAFWDTYWNDGIIPERYDAQSYLPTDNLDLFVDSPGLIVEPQELAVNVTNDIYHQNIFDYSNDYFHFLLMELGDTLYGPLNPGGYGMVHSLYIQLFNHYVYSYLGLSSNDVEIIETTRNVREETIKLVKQGIPVKLGIDGHAVVAYDYNEISDEIFVHFGWGPNTTHVTIESLGYDSYNNLIAFNFKSNHSHSNNYVFEDANNGLHTFCPCNSVIPNIIVNDSGNYLDLLPTFKWNSLIKEKWFRSIQLSHKFSILNANKQEVFSANNIIDNTYTLTPIAWDAAIGVSGSKYYISIGLESPVDPYWDDYTYSQVFDEPTSYSNKIQIKPNEWNFDSRYYFANEGIKTSTLFKDDFTITTSRLRCGYIENSYINMSPRRVDAGRSYFELIFNKAVYSYLYSVCLWSSSENLDGSAMIYVLNSNGIWTSDVDLKTDIALTTKEQGLKRYARQHASGIYGIRFEAFASATGTRNKGRLCIDDIVLSTNANDLNFYATGYSKTHS